MRALPIMPVLVLLLVSLPSAVAFQQEVPEQPEEGILGKILTFIDTVAHWLGKAIINLIELIAKVALPGNLIVPIGYLALLTIVLALFGLVEGAKKVIWLVVIVGWLLIILRVVLEVLSK